MMEITHNSFFGFASQTPDNSNGNSNYDPTSIFNATKTNGGRFRSVAAPFERVSPHTSFFFDCNRNKVLRGEYSKS